MCFNFMWGEGVDEHNPPKYKVAKKDITVYKILTLYDRPPLFDLRITYPHTPNITNIEPFTRGFEYEELDFASKALKWKMRGYISSNEPLFSYVVNGNAFHTFKKEKYAMGITFLMSPPTKIVEMIIPKGALYYENKTQIVTNRIIYPEK